MSLTTTLATLGRQVAYYPALAKFIGSVNAALFLCQFLYWRGRGYEGEIHKTREEIEEETGLSADEQRTAIRKLVTMGVLRVTKKGLPARNFYTFDWQALDSTWEEFSTTSHREPRPTVIGNPEQQSSGTPSNSRRDSRRLDVGIPDDLPYSKITKEITEETTTEITNTNARARDVVVKPKQPDLPELPQDLAAEFIAYRRAKRAPLTPTAWQRLLTEFSQAGMSPSDGVAEMMARGWQGFRASWMQERGQGISPAQELVLAPYGRRPDGTPKTHNEAAGERAERMILAREAERAKLINGERVDMPSRFAAALGWTP